MSNYTLLYYPSFSPESAWLRRVLLLADEVKRIVPNDVEIHDPDDLLALQDSIPGCLSAISPLGSDVAIENDTLPRLRKAFAFIARSKSKRSRKTFTVEISADGAMSVAGHVFLHNAKLSPIIHEELRRHQLTISWLGKLSSQEGFHVVDEAASDLILSGIAENISRRTGFDTITDKPVPFALNALNSLGVAPTRAPGGAEGALLASLTSILIPAGVASLTPTEYRNLRESYGSIRAAFKELTANLTRTNRLDRIQDPTALQDAVGATAQEFNKEYETFRKSRYSRNFKRWAPLYVGGLLTMASAAVPPVALGIAGVSLVVQVIQKHIEGSVDHSGCERTFNMLAGIRKDIIRRSGIEEII